MSSSVAIVVTCKTFQYANFIRDQMKLWQEKRFVDKNATLLTLEDPVESVGSGGATLNALLLAAEHLSAKSGFTVITPDIFINSKIFIFHCGRSVPYDPLGPAFLPSPSIAYDVHDVESLSCNLLCLLTIVLNEISEGSPPGLWVCGTDMMFHWKDTDFKVFWNNYDKESIVCISTLSEPDYAENHGIYIIDDDDFVLDIKYCKSSNEIKELISKYQNNINLVSSIVYFPPPVSEQLLVFYDYPPLDSCTYLGLDEGETPIAISLFFDMLLPACANTDKTHFILSGYKSGVGDVTNPRMQRAREILWSGLNTFKIKLLKIDSSRYIYLPTEPFDFMGAWKYMKKLCPSFHQCSSYVSEDSMVDKSAILHNSYLTDGVIIESNSVLLNCRLSGNIRINSGCIISDVTIFNSPLMPTQVIPTETFLTTFRSTCSDVDVGVQISIRDSLFNANGVKLFGEDLLSLMIKSGLTFDDVFGRDDSCPKNLYNARLFISADTGRSIPTRHSISELLTHANYGVINARRQRLFYDIGVMKMTKVLTKCLSTDLLPFYRSAAVDNYHCYLIDKVDNIARQRNISKGVVARCLAQISHILAEAARGLGGLRSGPAGNLAFQKAFAMLESEDISQGITEMAKERTSWLSRPDLLIRVARHYEGASQIIIRQACLSAKKYISVFSQNYSVKKSCWVCTAAPARLDIAGGWSDTPPITYEHGGLVTCLAIQIDGKKPIGCKIRFINEPHCKINFGAPGDFDPTCTLNINELHQLRDYNQPNAPGALVKAAFVFSGIIDITSPLTLGQQLLNRYGGGFEIFSWANVPKGSGLGTSSILAAVVLKALWCIVDVETTLVDIAHAVICVEQMLTTGGGWQDQVGGIVSGLKLIESLPLLPLHITWSEISLSDSAIQAIEDQLVLIYTGKTRLARNILQEVVRNWYAREQSICAAQDELVVLARKASNAFSNCDLAVVGDCISRYQELKVILAPGSLPTEIQKLRQVLKCHCYGSCLAGAGGGGFLYVIFKRRYEFDELTSIFSQSGLNFKSIKLHRIKICSEGLSVREESLS